MKKDLITIQDLGVADIQDIFVLTDELKADAQKHSHALEGKTLALIFQKPSNRTRVSFAVGMYQLGGHSIYLGPDEISLGVRETIKDVAKTLSRYVNGIILRTFAHENVIEMAQHAAIPVINGLSDLAHPCQALADIYTIKEKKGSLKGLTLAYIGDGNNVANSLIYCAAKTGMHFKIATPKQKKFCLQDDVVKSAKKFASASGSQLLFTNDSAEAAEGADVVYTDVWASMGQEKEAKERQTIFKNYQINKKLVSHAKKDYLFMHCLPAHRGQEVTDEVIDSKNSVVFDEAENRLHVQKAILIKLLKDK